MHRLARINGFNNWDFNFWGIGGVCAARALSKLRRLQYRERILLFFFFLFFFCLIFFFFGGARGGGGRAAFQLQPSLLIFLWCRCPEAPKGSPRSPNPIRTNVFCFCKEERLLRLSYYRRHMINRLITQQHQYKRQNNEGYH